MSTTITLHPLGDRVLLKVRPLPESTGLILRIQRNEYCVTADVLACGPEVRDIQPGMVVQVANLAGQAIEDQRIVHESSILAILEAA